MERPDAYGASYCSRHIHLNATGCLVDAKFEQTGWIPAFMWKGWCIYASFFMPVNLVVHDLTGSDMV